MAVACLSFASPLSAQAQGLSGTYANLTVTGTVDAQSDMDVRGNVFTLGSWDGNPNHPGITISYFDGISNALSLLRFTSSRPLHEWLFGHAATTGTNFISAMKLDAQHKLILSDTSSSNTARIILDPSAAQITMRFLRFCGRGYERR